MTPDVTCVEARATSAGTAPSKVPLEGKEEAREETEVTVATRVTRVTMEVEG